MKPRVSWSMWWSGVFGMLTVGHAARLVTGAAVTIGQTTVPLWVSQVIAPMAGLASFWLLARAYRAARCCHSVAAGHGLGAQGQQGADLESLSCSIIGHRDVDDDVLD